MAVTQAQLDALVQAWASGVLRVTYNGATTEYRSRADLEAQIAQVAAALGVDSPLKPASTVRSRTSLTKFSRG